jgi:ABC-type transport system involved in multi-copper enzyme maturation permease subunit
MLWKERHVARTRGVVRFLTRLVCAGVAAYVAYEACAYAWPAYTDRSPVDIRQLNVFLRVVTTLLYIVVGLAIASDAAGGVTSEREEDTWISLLSTPLGGDEIIPAKMIGSAWRFRPALIGLLLLWLIGVPVGSLHPFGLIALVVEFAVFLWFAVAIGTFLSLRSSKSSRAQSLAVGILVVINGGILCFGSCLFRSMLPAFSCTPMIVAVSALSGEEVGELLNGTFSDSREGNVGLTCLLGVLAYAVAAAVLTYAAIAGFDDAVDRPHRPLGGARRRPGPDKDAELELVDDEVP